MSENIDMINSLAGKSSTNLPPEMEDIRNNTILAIGEIICYGARVRPLSLGADQIGYIRGLRASERNWLSRMHTTTYKRTWAVMKAATTLSDSQLSSLSSLEARRLLKMILAHSRSDYSLTAWTYPYSTTSASEKMWASSIKPPRLIPTPDGDMPIYGISEVYLNWAYMASLREESKASIKATQDAVMLVRAQVGKGANALSQEVNNAADSLKANVANPWMDMGVSIANVDFDDGWGHTFQDSSLEGLMREYNGMITDDKHEQFIKACMERQRDEIIAEQERIKNLKGRVAGISMEERILTPEDMALREREIQAQKALELEGRRAWVDAVDAAATGARPWNFDL